MAMEKFRASPLPVPPREYDQQYMTQLIRVLGLYFSQIDSQTPMQNDSYRALNFYGGDFEGGDVSGDTATFNSFEGGNVSGLYIDARGGVSAQAMLTSGLIANSIVTTNIMGDNFYGGDFYGNGRHIHTPYNQFLSSTTQNAAAIDVAYAVKLETTSFTDGIYIAGANDTEITFTEPGVYSVTYSLSFKNTNNDGETVDIWVRYNGSDYADSNSRFFIPARKSTGDPSYLIAVTTITGVAQSAGDYIELMWRVSNVNVNMVALPAVTASAGVTPNIPATPSAIVQATFISEAFPPVTRVAPAPAFGFGEVGTVTVNTVRT